MAAAAILASAVLGVHRVHAEPDSESTDAKISAAKAASHAGVESWDTESVAAWLVLRGLPAEVVREAREADVDGATLLELTHEGWAELGVASKVAQAKIRAAVRRADHHAGAPHVEVGAGVKADFPKTTEVALFPLLIKRTPMRGAEHTRGWVTAFANANSDPAKTKEHVMRFLGMYNVVDLLSFTIAIQWFLTQPAASSWWGLLLQAVCLTCCYMTGLALGASTIMYNTCSTVSDANFPLFIKLPFATENLLYINDYSIGGFSMLMVMLLIAGIQLSLGELLPLKVDTEQVLSEAGGEYIAFIVCRILFVGVPGVLWNFDNYVLESRRRAFTFKIVLTTHASMFAGLMGDAEVLPPGERSGWAMRASNDEIEGFVCGLIESRLANPATYLQETFQRYASQSDEAIHTEASDSAPMGASDAGAMLAAALAGRLGYRSRMAKGGGLQLQ